MRASIVRSAAVALVAITAAVLSALTSTMTSVFTLAAATYIVGGTQFAFPFCVPFCGTLATPQQNIDLATPYVNFFVPPAQNPGNPSVVPYPASFWPISIGYFRAIKYDDAVKQGVAALPSPATIDSGSVIFGYSQGANVATVYKRNFNQYWASNPAGAPQVTFVLIGNGNRPNGGALERFNGLFIPGLEFTANGATPTTTAGAAPGQITTYDIAQQYDGFADFPTNPLNVLADANALIGISLVHLNYQGVNPNQAVFQATYGDTAYYLIPTYPLPLLMPLDLVPVVGPIAVDALDPALRVLVEAGYNRTTNPGVPTPANIFYFPNPINVGQSLLVAIPLGLQLAQQDITGARVPGTPPAYVQGQGTYGIGGPPVTLPGQTPPAIPMAQTVATTTSTPNDQQSTAGADTTAGPAATQATTPPPTIVPAAVTAPPTTPNPSPSPAPGPLLNVVRPSLGSPLLPIGNSVGSSGNGAANPVTSTINGVASAISGAVTNSLNAVTGALGGHPGSSGQSSTGGSSTGGGG
jgi:PE-PPE domain